MTVKKITYNKKAPFQTKPEIPVENQVTSDDLNEIKDIVNNNADELETKQPKEQGKGLSTNDFTNELKSKLENLNNYDDGEITAKVTELKENVEKIQKEQTTQNKEIEDLQTDNKKNKTDLQTIKQEQQDQNSKIENNTTENKDNTELLNQIMGLLPSVKGEGEYVTLQDTGEARFKKFEVQGNSKQETRTGKNKLPYPYKDLSSTVIQDLGDGRLILNGTLAENTYKVIQTFELKAGKYKILFSKTNIPNGSYILMSGKTSGQILQGKRANTSFELTNDETVTLGISILKGTYNQAPLDLMILEATEQDETFEQYGASPSPEFPSKIRNVGDNINLYSKDNANILNTMIDKQGLGVNAGDTYKTIYIPCKPNTTYTVSKLYDATKNRFALGFTDTEPTYSMKVEGYITNANVSDLTITTGTNAKYLLAYIWITGGTTTYKEMLDSIKIEEGVHATAYSPYNCGNAEITVGNKNLANTKIIKNTNIITVNEDGSITLANNSNTAGYASTGKKLNELCKGLKVGDTAYLKLITTSTNNIYLQGKANQYWLGNNSNKITKDMLEDTVIVYGGYNKTDKLQIQITKNAIGDYAQNEQQTIVFPFTEGQRLYKGDYLAENGMHHVRKQIVPDGTENWEHDSMGGTETCVCYKYKINDYEGYEGTFAPTGKLMCNYLKEQKIYANEQEGIIGGFEPYIFVKVKKSILETPDFPGFKKWLAKRKDEGNPFVIEYPLMQEIIEPYTQEQQEAYNKLKKLHSYNEQTNTFSTNEIGPIFNVEAIKNLNVSVLQQTTKES